MLQNCMLTIYTYNQNCINSVFINNGCDFKVTTNTVYIYILGPDRAMGAVEVAGTGFYEILHGSWDYTNYSPK